MIPTKRIWTAKPLIIAYIVAVGFTVGMLIDRTPSGTAVPTLAPGAASLSDDERPEPAAEPMWRQLFRPSQPTVRRLLRLGLPFLSVADGSAEAADNRTLRHIGLTDERPQTMFEAMLPFLKTDKERQLARETPDPPIQTPVVPANPNPDPPDEKPAQPESTKPPAVANGLPIVGIYHTHDWESYISEFPAFVPKTPKDLDKIASENHAKRTIMGVGRTVALRLKELGVGTVYAEYTHRELGYDYAYQVSRSTAKDILKAYPSVKVLLDLHRDAAWGLDLTANIGGKRVAQIRCVIGQSNAKWDQNKAFCDQLMHRLEQKHPGITLPTMVKEGNIFNQDVMRGAILLEIGGAMNQYAEADRAASYLAEALAEMIREDAYPR
ncbi:MAG: spoIIP [Symbiobacteriaceae bacterium]|nr:spoIIP [Symbiobacteriaceae bacterium]